MIESLKLIGFQAHKKILLKFDPRITAIVGATDKGKSAIIRALRWAACNKPFQAAWINHACKNAVAILRVDGNKIKRMRGSKGNSYALNGKTYKAFGSEVPKPIVQALKMGDLNFQSQHDSPFWFAESAGNVSRALNEIVDLGVIDDALSAVGSAVRHNKSILEVCEERLKDARAKTKELAYVEEMATEFRRLDARQTALIQTTNLIDNVRELVVELDDAAKLADIEVPDTSQINLARVRLSKANERHDELSQLLEEIEASAGRVAGCRKALREAEGELQTKAKGVCPTCHQKIK